MNIRKFITLGVALNLIEGGENNAGGKWTAGNIDSALTFNNYWDRGLLDGPLDFFAPRDVGDDMENGLRLLIQEGARISRNRGYCRDFGCGHFLRSVTFYIGRHDRVLGHYDHSDDNHI